MNEYRCETCKDILCKCNPKQDGIQFSPNWIFTRKYGCASHSDFQSERYRPVCYPDCENEKHIRKEERDKVLDLITTFRKEQSKELKIHDMWVAEAEYLKELRQARSP